MRTSGNIPNQVRATDLILDEGRVFAQPGDVGELLDAGEDDGIPWVMALFPSAPQVTTCLLGVEVKLVSAADASPEVPEPETGGGVRRE
ncbi:hypothetical protein [Myxococcus sp. Y35]|uniref:hypothetical protein n=1 Tax=Pseudomyxococcus flavus TaxID=3115648 RepID=UPI003CEB4CBB